MKYGSSKYSSIKYGGPVMTTTYPGAIDSYSVKVDNVDDVMAAHVNNLQDAVVACETALGTEGQTALCEGRLTLATGTPVTTADQTAKTTVYFTPYKGNRISIYNGSTGWVTYAFTEKSVAVPATTSTPFDVFAYISGGAVTLSTTNWTNDTTRATALTTQDGIYVKSGATGYRYLGTCRTTTVNGQTEDSIAKRYVWNYYNRVDTRMETGDSNSHTYGTAAYRSWNADDTVRVKLVVGVVEEPLLLNVIAQTTANAAGEAYVTLGLNTTSSASVIAIQNSYTEAMRLGSTALQFPALGYNYVQLLENAGGGVNSTFALGWMYVGSKK